MAFGRGKIRARVRVVSDDQTTLVARHVLRPTEAQARYVPVDFQVFFNADGTPERCRCPNDQETARFTRKKGYDGVSARFTVKEHCAGCPRWEQCRAPTANPTGYRTVYISDYYHDERAAVAFNYTDEAQQMLHDRWAVEPLIAYLVRYDGCRRARRVGQQAAEFQLKQACAMRNLRLWLARVQRGTAPPPPRVKGAA